MIQNEIWKPIKGYEGLYEISNYGNVRSLDRETVRKNGKVWNYKGHILNPTMTNGYKTIVLSNTGKQKLKYVHRLVAENFVDNPYGANVVNHIDGNKQNNYFNNLEWVTQMENISHATKHPSITMGRPTNNPRTEKIGFRMSVDEIADIQECADIMKTQRVNAVVEGIKLLKKELKK